MKNLILCIALFFLFQFKFYAQNQFGLEDNFSKAEKQLILSNQSEKIKGTVGNTNGIFIQQIGNFNSSNVDVIARSTEISLDQQGNNNSIIVSKEAFTVQQKIMQKGDNNNVFDIGGYSRHSVSMEFMQTGNNQNIHSFGTNSLSKDMKISQSGNGSTVIVVNLK
ncbi:hypothetical protein BXU11_06615 [Flavobacterium sp. LM5]|jgi:ribosomal protein L18|uniref:hypothetical protein n=1 Tax=Flavobacterium sp. LM5 TaxID=1938610 RepID=UPI0009918E48|nr:hypothetical protein [Flavobacterium sp. LM5]OOV29553.1 hypothetical protein BXU11_06615 [Flavobacterium sp. LM5]